MSPDSGGGVLEELELDDGGRGRDGKEEDEEELLAGSAIINLI